MGLSEEVKSEQSPSPAPHSQEQPSDVHVYPDWAAMQAYYGHRVALPPYFNSAVASGHPPHPYMWAPPQAVMPPYGPAYAAIYPHGGVYAHPAVPIGSQPLGPGVPSSTPAGSDALAGTALSMDTAAKKSGNADQGFVKKLKGLDGLAMSIGNGNSEKAEGGAEYRPSQSSESEDSTDDDGSDGNTTGTDDNKRRRSCEGTPTAASSEKAQKKATPLPAGQLSSFTDKVLGVPVASAKGGGKMMGTAVAPSSTATTLELRNPGANNGTGNSSTPVVSSENWNERELKRERRKQSNRESARRSRLRKQAEAEDLAKSVDSLNAENRALKSEIDQLMENSERLRHENAKLMEKLNNNPEGGGKQAEDIIILRNNAGGGMKRSTENLLSRVNNNTDSIRSSEEGSDVYERSGNNSASGAKLHQLLEANPRADAVAAG